MSTQVIETALIVERSGLADVYLAVRDQWPDNEPKEWDEICSEFFGLELPPTDEPEARYYVVQQRNAIKEKVNTLASRIGDGFRLKTFVAGKSVIKQVRRMVNREMEDRVSRVAGSLSLVRSRLIPMLVADGVSENDKLAIRQMCAVSDGATLAISGMIARLEGVDTDQRKSLLAIMPPVGQEA